MNICVVIPALNEAENIGGVVRELLSTSTESLSLDRVIVVDNGSEDGTSKVAAEAGAEVIVETVPGYSPACLAGVRAASDSDIIVFSDGDGSDDGTEWPELVEPIVADEADLVVGSRLLSSRSAKAITFHQRIANFGMATGINLLHGTKFTDIGPYRAIRTKSLLALELSDLRFAWTLEMQMKALRLGLKVKEIQVKRKERQGGDSKISGSIIGSLDAARCLGTVMVKEYWRKLT